MVIGSHERRSGEQTLERQGGNLDPRDHRRGEVAGGEEHPDAQ